MKRMWIAVCVLFLTVGCALKHPNATPVTGYEKVAVVNASLAETNNSIVRGVIQLQSSTPPVFSQAVTGKILRITAAIAADDNKLTLILDQGSDVAKGRAPEIQALIAAIVQEIDNGIQDGSFGVKNPTSQQLFTSDLEAIKGLALEIAKTLKTVGVLE